MGRSEHEQVGFFGSRQLGQILAAFSGNGGHDRLGATCLRKALAEREGIPSLLGVLVADDDLSVHEANLLASHVPGIRKTPQQYGGPTPAWMRQGLR